MIAVSSDSSPYHNPFHAKNGVCYYYSCMHTDDPCIKWDSRSKPAPGIGPACKHLSIHSFDLTSIKYISVLFHYE